MTAARVTLWELSVRVSRRMGITMAAARGVIEVACEEISNKLSEGGAVRLPGLGTLTVHETAAKRGRNIRTGEAITIPAGRRVAFSQAGALKAALKQNEAAEG
jgi:DNA-binding protein HU-beta